MTSTRCATLRVFLVCCLAIACSVSLFAQGTNARITGIVTDQSKAIIRGAQVIAINEDTGVRHPAQTNSSGIYIVPSLIPGTYRVEIQSIGFKTVIKPGLVLHVQDVAEINFEMAVGSTSESVTVSDSGSTLNTTNASVSTVVGQEFVKNIPLNGRSFQDLISMTPGVVTQSPQSSNQVVGVQGDFSVNGQRTQSNYYTVDGVSANISAGNAGGVATTATGGAIAGGTTLGTTQTMVSVDALQEFRVQSSTYSAEYGRSPGGQFSLATRSGTDMLHGSAFDYLRNGIFDGNDWFNDHYGKTKPILHQNDFGGTLGGPIRIPGVYDGSKRSFFFVSYEGLRLTQPSAATIQYVPDLFMRQQAVAAMQPILNAFPLPTGTDYGTASSPNVAQFISPFALPSSINSTSVRLDHTLGSKLSLFFRFGDTPSSTQTRSNFARTTTNSNAQTYTLGINAELAASLANEFRMGYDRTNASQLGTLDDFGGATPINLANAMGGGGFSPILPIVYFSLSGIGSSTLAPYYGRNLARQWNVVDTLNLSYRTHTIKFGVDYRHIKAPISPPSVEPYAIFQTAQSLLKGTPTIPYVFNLQPSTPLLNQVAAFAQDEWRIHPRLSLSYGIRWEVNPPPTEQHDNDAYTLLGDINSPSSLSLAPRGTPLWNTTWYNLAPRLGVAWTAHDTPGRETVIRAGGGVFFDSPNEIATLGFSQIGFRTYKVVTGASIPFTIDQLTLSKTVAAPYTNAVIIAFPPHLQLPYSLQWNVALQQALGNKQSFTLSYVAASGRRLMQLQQRSLSKLNANFGTVEYFAGGVTSNYQSLQVLYQRSVAHGLHALASYTWSHSLDYGSNSTALPLQRGDSDYDVRNNAQAGLTWDLPTIASSKTITRVINDWGLDSRLNLRTAFPISLGGSTAVDAATGSQYSAGLNVIAGQPLYLYGAQYPGGKALNKAAFSLPASGTTGNAPRNFVRGFGAAQLNLALRREFELPGSVTLQFRAETFNLFNHPNFGYVDSTYTDATFGQATQMLASSLGTVASQYQQGGSRSMQFALKAKF